MRWLGLSLLTVCAVMVGCEQPMEDMETIPPIPSSNATTDDGMLEDGALPTTGSTAPDLVAPAIEAPPVDAPPVEAPAIPDSLKTEPVPAETPASEPKDDSASKTVDKVRFVADTSLKVPTMMCPFSCWPKVKETLAAQPGVEDVQLAKQAKEGEIDNPVVELKVKSGFDSAAAIAALKKASFDEAKVIN